MKQKGSSDVKGSLWNHLDKKVLLWHREAPLFLRVWGSDLAWEILIQTMAEVLLETNRDDLREQTGR